MKVTVRPYLLLRKYNKDFAQSEDLKIIIPENTILEDIIRKMQIPLQEVGMVMVNGLIVELNYLIKDNDYIQIFPPIMGG